MPAVVRLDFDPTAHLLGLSFRLETMALAGVILVVLVLAALRAGRTRASEVGDRRLRRDDLFLIVFGALPGAFVGGRLDYVLIHLDYYRANPNAIADVGQGSIALTGAVLFGTMTALLVARLLEAPARRWLHLAAVPLLVGLGLGKLAMVLGGAGQGRFSNAGYATTYAHDGTWESANPAIPAIPSQALEGVLVLLVALAIVVVPVLLRFRVRRWRRIVRPGRSPRRDWGVLLGARRFLVAILLWCGVRFGVAFTWRDAQVLGPLGAEQLVTLAVAAGDAALLAAIALRDYRRSRPARPRPAPVPVPVPTSAPADPLER